MTADETKTPPPKKNDESFGSIIVGLVFIALLIFGGYKLISSISGYIVEAPADVALSAYFADESGNPITNIDAPSGHLTIKGQVSRAGQPVTAGKVRITVNTLDDTFRQAFLIDIKEGRFEITDPAFNSLKPADQVHIRGEVLGAKASEAAPEDLFLNTRPPKVTTDTLWWLAGVALVIVFVVFFYAFTGKKTPWKNRIAIIFSYCVIGIFLILPLLSPIFLVPNDRRGMIGKPVGLVLTRIGTIQDGKIQWALNIGGYTTAPLPDPSPSPSPSATPVTSPTVPRTTGNSTPPGTVVTSTPSPTPASTPQSSPTATAPANAAGPSPAASPAKPAQAASTPQQQPTPAPNDNDNVVDVQGGLVIPLYIIILSVIGGAINMTRKVPRLQEEGERSEIKRPTLQGFWWQLRHPLGGKKTEPDTEPPTVAPPASSPASGTPPVTTASGTDPATTAGTGAPPAPGAQPATTPPATRTDPAATTGGATPPTSGVPAVTPAAVGGATPAPVEEEKPDDTKAAEIDTKLEELLESYLKNDNSAQNNRVEIRDLVDDMQRLFDSSKTRKPILGFDSFDEWIKSRPALREMLSPHWRVELLNQYMYLMSAPFLAIVAYYMLDLLGLTKQPILVLISFSVGLISEKILSWLLGLASGYLRGENGSAPATK